MTATDDAITPLPGMVFTRYGVKASMLAGFVGVSASAVVASCAVHVSLLIFSVFLFGFSEVCVIKQRDLCSQLFAFTQH